MRNSKSQNLHHKRLLNRLLVIGVCAGCVGYSSNTAAMMETIRDMFFCCGTPKAEDLTSLRLSVDVDEVNASYKAYDESFQTTDPEKAYNLLIIAYCGDGRSAFSKKFKVIVENTVKEFCEDQDMFVGDFDKIMMDKFMKQTMDFCKHNNKPIVECYRSLSKTLSTLAELHQATGNMDEAVFLQKQAIFWCFLYAKDDLVRFWYLGTEIEKLRRMQNA